MEEEKINDNSRADDIVDHYEKSAENNDIIVKSNLQGQMDNIKEKIERRSMIIKHYLNIDYLIKKMLVSLKIVR